MNPRDVSAATTRLSERTLGQSWLLVLGLWFRLARSAVCNTKNVELVRPLGADEVLDYTHGDDFTKNSQAYDVVVDAVGKHSFMRSRHALKAGGSYVSTDGRRNFVLPPLSRLGSRRVALPIARARKDDVLLLKQLLENGEYRAVIDRSYRLEDIVDASRYVETQQKTGNVVLTVSSDRKT